MLARTPHAIPARRVEPGDPETSWLQNSAQSESSPAMREITGGERFGSDSYRLADPSGLADTSSSPGAPPCTPARCSAALCSRSSSVTDQQGPPPPPTCPLALFVRVEKC